MKLRSIGSDKADAGAPAPAAGDSSDDSAVPSASGALRVAVVAAETAEAAIWVRRIESGPWPRIQCRTATIHEVMSLITRQVPDVMVVIDHDDVDPLNVTKNVHSYRPELPVLICSPRRDAVLASRLLRAGAQGYLLEMNWVQDLTRSLVLLDEGGRFVSEEIMQVILQNLAEYQQENELEGIDRLSDRELIIFQFIGLGHAAAKIARELHVSAKTVSTHQANIKRKMHLRTNAALRVSAQRWVRQRSPNTITT